ncbi:MAG: hypothetical protein WCP52_03285 [Bacteroidota bacterium]
MKIQIKFKMIAMVIGCFITLISIVFSCNCLKIKTSMMPKIIGSVGKLSPSPPSRFCRFIARGVRKTTKSMSLSKENKASSTTNIIAGTKLK